MASFARSPQRLLLAGLVLVSLLTIHHQASGQGKFEGVSDDEVREMKLNHYYTADKKYHDVDFEWTFAQDTFILKAGKGEIPADLQEQLLLKGTTAREIRGKWHLEDRDGKALVLSAIQADGAKEPQKKTAALPIYKTAPTVIRVGQLQYVFFVGP